jgi:hypothetical protein
MPHDNLPQPTKNATKWAIGFTAVWLCCFFVLLFIKRCTISELALNEWGDLIAGTFAPLAFFWLVYGYFQQGLELRLSREALLLQQRELAEQVKATHEVAAQSKKQALASVEMVNVAREDLSNRLALERFKRTPRLNFMLVATNANTQTYQIKNAGGPAYSIEISAVGHTLPIKKLSDPFGKDQVATLSFTIY